MAPHSHSGSAADSMEGMGMDSGSNVLFKDLNSALALAYWYMIVAVVAFCFLLKIWNAIDARWRIHLARNRSTSHPTRPQNFATQTYATILAIAREASYPQLWHFSGKYFSWLNPPSLGRSLALLTYWIVIILMMTIKSIVNDAYYWERIAFRAAWISISQLPLIYLLAGKVSIVGWLVGSSYERLNWLHRWVARTLFVTVTIHGAFFLTEWYLADFIELELALMPTIKYGVGAWGVLGWTMISSMAPFRRMAHELFVLQHLASAGILLWLLYVHVPSYAMYNIWLAIGFVAFDRVLRLLLPLVRNLSFGGKFGHSFELQALDEDLTLLTIHDLSCSWKPGQHIQVCFLGGGLWNAHPFTISNVSTPIEGTGVRNAELVIRAHSGYTRKIQQFASSKSGNKLKKAFISGPYGAPPVCNSFQTVVLISSCTGASFTLPILESILGDPGCVQRVDFLLIVRKQSHSEYYLQRLRKAMKGSSVSLRVEIAITSDCMDGPLDEGVIAGCCSKDTSDMSSDNKCPTKCPIDCSGDSESSISGPSDTLEQSHHISEKPNVSPSTIEIEESSLSIASIPAIDIKFTRGRPDIAAAIRDPVEAASGETSVVVCGRRSLSKCVRNRVAVLSDERAVHKGSGAQGIHLYVEEYGF
ncbi:MAG: hypothetical protein M1829_005753 [Trizodia sp. TS-e1964]|nr:MAG: hypothetical protein M1829_005753 [Trizodia sp. TS-e1964]